MRIRCVERGFLIATQDWLPAPIVVHFFCAIEAKGPQVVISTDAGMEHSHSPSPQALVHDHCRLSESQPQTNQRGNRVKIHVYDLVHRKAWMATPLPGCKLPVGPCFAVVNDALHLLGTGAYHAGIEVNGIEYSYGSIEKNGVSGMFTCVPRKSRGYKFRSTVDLGEIYTVDRCNLTSSASSEKERDVRDTFPAFVEGARVMEQMSKEYMGRDYHFCRRNCCTFVRDACIRLGVNEDDIPDWFLNLTGAARIVDDALDKVYGNVLGLSLEEKKINGQLRPKQ